MTEEYEDTDFDPDEIARQWAKATPAKANNDDDDDFETLIDTSKGLS